MLLSSSHSRKYLLRCDVRHMHSTSSGLLSARSSNESVLQAEERAMSRRFVNLTMGLMCITLGVVVGGAFLFDVITGQLAHEKTLSQAVPVHQETTIGRPG